MDRPLDKTEQENTMVRVESWLTHTEVSKSFKLACELWDAMFAGIKKAGDNLIDAQDKKLWGEVDSWLSPRRLAT